MIDAANGGLVELVAEIKGKDGNGLAGVNPIVTMTRGSVSSIRDEGYGKYAIAIDVPPLAPPRLPEFFIVIVSASVEDAAPVSAIAIPVISKLEMKGKSSPGVVMSARIPGKGRLGEKSVADEKGAYNLVVPVPPGVSSIEVVLSKGGAERVSKVDLKIKKRDWVLIQALPEIIEAQGGRSYISVASYNFDGTPYKKSSFKLNCLPGTCDAGSTVSSGVFQYEFYPQQDFEGGLLPIKLSAQNTSAGVSINIVKGIPSKIVLTADVLEVAPGSSVTLDASVLTGAGLPIEANDVVFRLDDAPGAAAEPRGEGRYRYIYDVPIAAKPGESVAIAECVTETGTRVQSNELRIRITEPKVELIVEDAPKSIGSGAKVSVTVRAKTPTNPGVENLILKIFPDGGEAGAVTQLGGGRYRFELTAPDTWPADSLKVEVSAPDANGSPSVDHNFAWDVNAAASNVPARLALSSSPDKIMPGDKAVLTATVYSEAGNGITGQTVNISSAGGTAGAVRDAGAGAYSTELTISDTAEPGKVKAEASCECGGKNLTAEADIEVLQLPPSAISVAAVPDSIYVSGKTESEIEVTLKNKFDRGVPGEKVTVQVTQEGETESISGETGSDGVARLQAEMKRPDGIAKVTAVAESNSSLSASADIRKMIYDVARIELKTTADELPADGVATVEVEAYAIDEMGNDASFERIDFVLQDGSGKINKAYCTTESDARCSIIYTAGLACGTVEVEASSFRQKYIKKKISFTETPKVPASMVTSSSILGGPLSSTRLIADNTSEALVSAVVRDAGNCLIEGERIYFQVSSGAGSVTDSVVTDADGEVTATYTTGFAVGDETVLVRTETSPLVMNTEDFTVDPWVAVDFNAIAAQSYILAGETVSVSLTARDAIGRTVTTYDPSTSTFVFSGPGTSPGGNAPQYPANAAVISAFNAGVANITGIQLFDDETTTITVRDNHISGRTGNIRVANNVVERIFEDGGDGSYIAVNGTAWLQAHVEDAYGNPVQNVETTFSVTGGNGLLTGAVRSTNASGHVSPGSFTVGADVRNDHQVTATIATGTTRTALFNLHSATPPTAAFTVSATSVCPGTNVLFNGTTSTAAPPLAPTDIVSYSWDFEGNGIATSALSTPSHVYNASGTYSARLTVYDSHWLSDSHTETITVTPSLGTSELVLTASPNVIAADGVATTTISSGTTLSACSGSIPDGVMFTVTTTQGTIDTPDADPAPGIQIASNDGRIQFVLRSNLVSGTAVVTATGNSSGYPYSDTVDVVFGDSGHPIVVYNYPSGKYTAQVFNAITVKFNKNVQDALVTDPANFTVTDVNAAAAIAGVRSYNATTKTVTFTPAVPIDINTIHRVAVLLSSNIRDIAGNQLAPSTSGAPADFEFVFGLDGPMDGVTCTYPVTVSCSATPDKFSPNGDNHDDQTHITFRMTDNHGINRYRLDIEEHSGTVIRSVTDLIDAVDDGANLLDETRTFDWDGRDDAGNIADNGEYTIKAVPYDFSSCYDLDPNDCHVDIDNPIHFHVFGP